MARFDLDPRKPFRVDLRNWNGPAVLDLVMKPDGYVAWRERALGVIAADRLDVRKWLLWAETQSQSINCMLISQMFCDNVYWNLQMAFKLFRFQDFQILDFVLCYYVFL